jgi:hypothetical protein
MCHCEIKHSRNDGACMSCFKEGVKKKMFACMQGHVQRPQLISPVGLLVVRAAGRLQGQLSGSRITYVLSLFWLLPALARSYLAAVPSEPLPPLWSAGPPVIFQ